MSTPVCPDVIGKKERRVAPKRSPLVYGTAAQELAKLRRLRKRVKNIPRDIITAS